MSVMQTPVFVSGEDDYDTYRIPALVVTGSGTLLAFCEGRRRSRSDTGDIDLLLKRSEDGGATWSHQQLVWEDSGNTCGNPAPVVDRESGVVWLLMTWNRGDDQEKEIIAGTSNDTRRVFVTWSQDDGRSWAAPREITEDVKKSSWTWYATGPGAGIQLERGRQAGRLIIPCDHIESITKHYYSHVIYSDDHGASWRLGGTTPRHQVNECQVVELANGRLLLNMRNYDRAKKHRQVAFSEDGGNTWIEQRFDESLVEPICQASIRRAGSAILFSNPSDADQRINMTVQLSTDEGNSWRVLHRVHSGPSAYSDLAVLPEGKVGCLYERGIKHPYETITLALFPFEGK
jgi:sialidase-1